MNLSKGFLLFFALPAQDHTMAVACRFAHLSKQGRNPHHEDTMSSSMEAFDVAIPHRKLQSTFQGSTAQAIVEAKEDIQRLMRQESRFGPLFVRMGFHDCVGGCDGCIDLSNPANDGLERPIQALQETVSYYANQLTRADVWALASLTAAENMQEDAFFSYDFDYFGRTSCDSSDGTGGPDIEMPLEDINTDEILTFFEEQFGFNTRQTVAIMGAHTLGRLSDDNSGFSGTWTRDQTELDNEFFRLLINNGDDYRLTDMDNSNGRKLWVRSNNNGGGFGRGDDDDRSLQQNQGGSSSSSDDNGRGGRRLVMLNADMALVGDFTVVDSVGTTSCLIGECPPAAETYDTVREYSQSNRQWLEDFRDVMTLMTLNGYNPVSACDSPPCSLTSFQGQSTEAAENGSAGATSSAAESSNSLESSLGLRNGLEWYTVVAVSVVGTIVNIL